MEERYPNVGRRRFIGAMAGLGLGATALGIEAAARRGSVSDRFEAAVGRNLCVSPLPASAQHVVSSSLPRDLTLVGTRLMKLGFLDELARTYELRTGRRVRIVGDGCDGGLLATRAGKAHFGELCCPIERSPAAGMWWLPVAQDIKAILTSPANPVDNISLADLRRAATGKIRSWRELGGRDEPIAFIVHNHCPRYLEPVRDTLLVGGTEWSKYAMRSNTDSDHLRQLARFRTSLGVDSWVLAEPYVKRGDLKVLSVDGVMHNTDRALCADYPLMGPLNLIFTVWVDDLMRPFLNFLYSDEGQAIIARTTVPVRAADATRVGDAPDYTLNPRRLLKGRV